MAKKGTTGERAATPADVRATLVDALALDLVGPAPGSAHASEVLSVAPSRWYLTGFLVPFEASDDQKHDPTGVEDVAQGSDGGGADDDDPPESASARRAPFPSSLGISVLVPLETKELDVVVRWGDYTRAGDDAEHEEWRRTPREVAVPLSLGMKKIPVPGSAGPTGEGALELVVLAKKLRGRAATVVGAGSPARAVSIFLVNKRDPSPDDRRDEAFVFQATLELRCEAGFVPRPDRRGHSGSDWDERVAELQFREVCEHAVGHGVATRAHAENGACRRVETTWIPRADVEKVVPGEVPGAKPAMFEMRALAETPAASLAPLLSPLIDAYAVWIAEQRDALANLDEHRRATGTEMLARAEGVRRRMAAGVELLATDPRALRAFQIANRAMDRQARQRDRSYDAKGERPAWRPFQLAFLLLNLSGLVDETHHDRETVDLLFFPTGGGKTEAYLGLAAFAIVYRRLTQSGPTSAGVAVLMRYTLRLLTLDQLERAAALICALELERKSDIEALGSWPFEIGLWVGQAATPNRIGKKGDDDRYSARAKVIAHQSDPKRNPSPAPLEICPWCRTRFVPSSFVLMAGTRPSEDYPSDLRIGCKNRDCPFSPRNGYLPIVTVDEAIYRRLPCFVIATVDKLASLPWVGQTGALFGKVDRFDRNGFYGAADPGFGEPLPAPLRPPELVIQDELHLISGPLGTVAGLYETVVDALSTRVIDGKPVRPKIVASTATVRRAEAQIQALFARPVVEVFPPPGPDLRDSFFAKTVEPEVKHARCYMGVAAQGRSMKVLLLRTYLALMAAAQKAYDEAGADAIAENPADPYMPLVGYFNSLRELGGSRRIVEDEVHARLLGYGARVRVGEKTGPFAKRKIAYEVLELTSRETTSKVADTKRRLAIPHGQKEAVDVALATNMISVGLDITRLGLMVVLGQPKTAAEYIQSTSRVGRDDRRPGLVVTLMNIHRPRDRSHYERFASFHAAFYRAVEATSVTPFAPRAVDRALAPVAVALARHLSPEMTPPRGAALASTRRASLDAVSKIVAARYEAHARDIDPAALADQKDRLERRTQDLVDAWAGLAHDLADKGEELQYQREEGSAKALLRDPLDPELDTLEPRFWKFRAGRSMRGVEPSVNVWVRASDGTEIEEDA